MFDKLIVSEPDRSEVKHRRNYFMVSSLVVGLLFITGVVISIFAADYSLGTGEFELTEMLAPVEMAANAPEPVRQPQNQVRSTSPVATRPTNTLNIIESPRVPTDISTTPSNVAARPIGQPFEIGPLPKDPAGGGTTGDNVARSSGDGPSGIQVAENKPTSIEDTPPPPRIETPKKNVVVSKGPVNGLAKYLPKPVYSAAARAVRADGAVNVQVTIDETGKVTSAHASGGHPMLRKAAEEAARQARFTPTILGDSPVKVTGVITYNFIL